MKSNKEEFDACYRGSSLAGLLAAAENYGEFLDKAAAVDTSWVGLYMGGFRERLKGSKVVELGSGDGLNALIMAKLGAGVTAVDSSEVGIGLLHRASAALGLPVECIAGDFFQAPLPAGSFDFVVGKGFLHHIPREMEDSCFSRIAALLRKDGEARFCEPAVNSFLLDRLRWAVPVPGRPSSLDRRAFLAWKERDPHPDRDNSSAHYWDAFSKHFGSVEILPFGGIERLCRLLPRGRCSIGFRRWAYRFERALPFGVNSRLARAQAIILRLPLAGKK
ncbi:MAG: class I SAM-dependent methyltransferase [Elusimicrobia bacterium]|nr:class I SAM-dependent methyltransferase [Elusimicrobiota bacterium]